MLNRCLALCLVLAGCAAPYDPPLAGDHTAAKYQADLVRCRKQAATAAARKANASPQTAVAALFDSGDAERQDVVACMKGRGHSPATEPASPPAKDPG